MFVHIANRQALKNSVQYRYKVRNGGTPKAPTKSSQYTCEPDETERQHSMKIT